MADIIIVETYIGKLPETTIKHVSRQKNSPGRPRVGLQKQSSVKELHTPLHSTSSLTSNTTLNSNASIIPQTQTPTIANNIPKTALIDATNHIASSNGHDRDNSPNCVINSYNNSSCKTQNNDLHADSLNNLINNSSRHKSTSEQHLNLQNPTTISHAEKSHRGVPSISGGNSSLYYDPGSRSSKPSLQRFDDVPPFPTHPNDPGSVMHQPPALDKSCPQRRRGCGDPSCPLRRPQNRLYRSVSLPAPSGVWGVVRPNTRNGRRSSWSTLLRHYYPEGGWGWLVLGMTAATSVLTHGLHTSYGALLVPLATKFQITVPLAGKHIIY